MIEGAEQIQKALPFNVIGSSFRSDGTLSMENKRGRQYPWGFVDCDDERHSDLKFLRKVLLMYVPRGDKQRPNRF